MTAGRASLRFGGGRPNDKRRHDEVIVRLRAELSDERQARLAAERNAMRFHAMLLAERIGRLPTSTHSAVTAGGAALSTADQAPEVAARTPEPTPSTDTSARSHGTVIGACVSSLPVGASVDPPSTQTNGCPPLSLEGNRAAGSRGGE